MYPIELITYQNETAFNVASRALMHGYKAHGKAAVTIDTLALGKEEHHTGLVVYGTTKSSAYAMLNTTLRSDAPDNIMCLGLECKPDAITAYPINGHVLVMPDLDKVSNKYIAVLAKTIMLAAEHTSDNYNSLYDRNCLKIHVLGTELESRIFSALFEEWSLKLLFRFENFRLLKPKGHYGLKYDILTTPDDDALGVHLNHLQLAQFVLSTKIRIKRDETPVVLTDDLAVFNARTLWYIINMLGNRTIWFEPQVVETLFRAAIATEVSMYCEYEEPVCDEAITVVWSDIPVTSL